MQRLCCSEVLKAIVISNLMSNHVLKVEEEFKVYGLFGQLSRRNFPKEGMKMTLQSAEKLISQLINLDNYKNISGHRLTAHYFHTR
jgi:hypothetical protein